MRIRPTLRRRGGGGLLLFCVVGRRGGEREGGNSVRGKFDEGREEGELSEE